MPYRDQVTSLKATELHVIVKSEEQGISYILGDGGAVRNFIPENSAPQTAQKRPSFHPPLLHLTESLI